jgi:hypothetical protein
MFEATGAQWAVAQTPPAMRRGGLGVDPLPPRNAEVAERIARRRSAAGGSVTSGITGGAEQKAAAEKTAAKKTAAKKTAAKKAGAKKSAAKKSGAKPRPAKKSAPTAELGNTGSSGEADADGRRDA